MVGIILLAVANYLLIYFPQIPLKTYMTMNCSSYCFDAPCDQDQCVTSPDSGQYSKTADWDQVGVVAAGQDQVRFVQI